jgi:hypothetical protein
MVSARFHPTECSTSRVLCSLTIRWWNKSRLAPAASNEDFGFGGPEGGRRLVTLFPPD